MPERAESSDRSLELELEPSSEVRSAESESLPKSDDSVLSPVVEDRPRSDDAVSPVPSVLELPELPDELVLLPELLVLEEELPVEMPPEEIDGMDGMDGPEIVGIEGMVLWAASRAGVPHKSTAKITRQAACVPGCERSVLLQY